MKRCIMPCGNDLLYSHVVSNCLHTYMQCLFKVPFNAISYTVYTSSTYTEGPIPP